MFKKKSKLKEANVDIISPNVTKVTDLFSPDGVIEGHSDIQLGLDGCRIYSVMALPRRLTVGWLDEILGLGGINISVRLDPAKDAQVSKTLLAKITQIKSQYIMDQNAGNIGRIPQLESEMADYEALYSAVQLGQDRLLHGTLLIKLHAKTPEELRTKSETFEAICARKGVRAVVLTLRQVEGLKCVLPLNFSGLEDNAKNFTTGSAMTCLPLTTAAGGHTSGVMLGLNLFTNSAVFLDRFGGERLVSNPHIFISGMSGSGKSVTLRQLALLEAYAGVRAAFVDVEGEYVNFVKKVGGKVITLVPGKFSGINPLDIEAETDERGQVSVNLTDKVEDFRGLVSTVFEFYNGKGLSVLDASLLEEAILAEYASRGITTDPESLYENGIKKPMPTISSVQQCLLNIEKGQKLAGAMRPLLNGGTVGMFDGQTSIMLRDINQICFNLQPLGGEFTRFVGIYATLSWLWQNFAIAGGKAERKTIAVDEAWMFLKHKAAASYLETLARRGRKHGCGLIIATQRFEEFASSPEGRAVIESCATIMVLKQEEQAASAAVDYFHLAPGCIQLLSQASAGEAIMRVSGDTLAIQISPAPFEWELVDTKLRV